MTAAAIFYERRPGGRVVKHWTVGAAGTWQSYGDWISACGVQFTRVLLSDLGSPNIWDDPIPWCMECRTMCQETANELLAKAVAL